MVFYSIDENFFSVGSMSSFIFNILYIHVSILKFLKIVALQRMPKKRPKHASYIFQLLNYPTTLSLSKKCIGFSKYNISQISLQYRIKINEAGEFRTRIGLSPHNFSLVCAADFQNCQLRLEICVIDRISLIFRVIFGAQQTYNEQNPMKMCNKCFMAETLEPKKEKRPARVGTIDFQKRKFRSDFRRVKD